MSQPTDIVLDGTGYMVAPGGYRRASDGVAEGRARRTVQRDFFGGQHRAIQLERDRGWDGLTVHATLGGQGIEPWPRIVPFADLGFAPRASLVPGYPCQHVVIGPASASRPFVSINGKLYRCPTGTTTTWSGLTLAADFGAADIRQLAPYVLPSGGERIAVALGDDGDIRLVNPDAVPASAVETFRAGEKATTIGSYGGILIYGSALAGEPHVLRFSDGTDVDTRALDAPIVAIGQHQGRLAIATRSALWLLGGHWEPAVAAVTDPGTGAVVTPRRPARWVGDPEPFFSAGFWTNDHDFPFLVSFSGRLYTFLGHALMEYDADAGSTKQGWRSVGLTAAAAYGACVAGGHLIVALETWQGRSDVWAFDGVAWWRIIAREVGPDATACWPLPTAGGANVDLAVLRDLSSTVDLVRLIARGPDLPALAGDGEYRTSLLDGAERDQPKAWRRVGAVFATPESWAGDVFLPAATVRLDVSMDAGITWLPVATRSVTNLAPFSLDAAIPETAASSPFIQLRVAWGGVHDVAPVLVGLWAEYEPLDTPLRRRRWKLSLHVRDDLVERDGARHAVSARAQSSGLWTSWQNGQTVAFRDIDFDQTSRTDRVRVTGIEEQIARPSDAERAGSVLTVSLVEV